MSMLAANPVLDEIRRLHDERRTGILALTNGKGKRVDICFREGLIEAASSNLDARRLGDYLIRNGALQARDLDAVQAEAKQRKIAFGEAAVRRRLLDQAEVQAAVRSQAMDLIEHALKNEFSAGSFTSSLRSYYVPARISFSHVLLEFCRNAAVPFEAGSSLRMALSDSIDLSVFPWYPQELGLLSELKYPGTIPELSKRTGMQETNLKKILGVLDRLGALEMEETPEQAADAADGGALARNSDFAFADLIPLVTNAVLHEKLEVARNESSFTSEQFKNLKVQIREANSKAPLKVITVSSPDAQDGKSLISANLAFSFAMDPGRRVIIVDCDLRNPALESYLGVPSEPGLLQHLGNGHLSPYCYVRRLENLYFLTAGGLAPNPIEVLSMKKMRQLIEDLKKDFDTIILDAPPYSPIADARIVTGLSDGLIMVVRRGKTSYSSIDRAFSAIDRNKLLGVVFNDVKPMLFHTYQNFDNYNYGRKEQLDSKSRKIRTGPRNYLQS